MLDWVRKKTEAMVGMGFAIAGKAVAQMLDLVFDAARLVQKTTGVAVPVESEPSPYEQESSWQGTEPQPDALVSEPPAKSESVEPPRPAEAAAPERAPQPAKKEPTKATKTTAAKARPKAKTARKKAQSRGKSAQRRSQILRILEILAEDPNRWMTAVEISKVTDAQGKKILPGNIRKAIRLRGEGLIDSRIRADSVRGATEYRITKAGLRYLSEHAE